MSARANYYKIGLFVISAATIAVMAIIVLGVGTFFRKKVMLETYIKESVQGLDIGSPIKFRGVQVGTVDTITLVAREYPTNRRYVMVRVSIYPDAFRVKAEEMVEFALQMEIEKGLRVRMASQGLTGTAYLEVDYVDPHRYPPLEIDWEPHYPYLPSAPSTITRFSESVERILRTLEQLNILGIAEELERTLTATTKALEVTNVEKIGKQGEQLLAEIRETNRRIGQILGGKKFETILSDASATMAAARRIVKRSEKPLNQSLRSITAASTSINNLAKKLDSISGDLPETFAQLRRTLRRLDNLVAGQQNDIQMTIENIRLISENLRELTEDAKKYPSQVLFGGPPRRSEHKSP
ncbi:MAG: MCE family protein [Deltaproteobacteria bacterium]|nr:MCE family protein [Deltaproteobacteria bacterium]MBW2305454.1 MCE family protein [Deltaproteobacteria bacterium]